MAIEPFGPLLATEREILFNLEINNRCSFTSRCGRNCCLNVLGEGLKTESLPENILRQVAHEAIWSGGGIRHLAVVGKEPLESPGLLLAILKDFHAAPGNVRPSKIGVITAAARMLAGLSRCLAEFPLDWLAISVDVATSGLRLPQNSGPLLESALAVRQLGGVVRLGVNTVFKDQNWMEALTIGDRVAQAGVDQWTFGPHLMPDRGVLRPTVSIDTVRRVVDAVANRFKGVAMDVAIELDYEQLLLLLGNHPQIEPQLRRWRIEIPLEKNVRLIAKNPRRGFFLRVRHDGQMLDRHDFRRVGLQEGSYGQYEAGRIAQYLHQTDDHFVIAK